MMKETANVSVLPEEVDEKKEMRNRKTHKHTHKGEKTGRTETIQACILSLVGILCAAIFVKHDCA